MEEIHISDIRSFRQCRRKWSWSSRLGRNLEPAIPYAPFFTGKAIHAALEFFYAEETRPEDTIDKYLESEEEYLEQVGTLWPQEREKLDEEIFNVRQIVDHYFLWQENDELAYADRNLEFIEMERSWEVPTTLPGTPALDVLLSGRFDGFCKHIPTNRYYVLETKTARSVQSFLHTLATDQQSTLYQWAAEKTYDVPISGVLFNIMSKTLPKRPARLKSGRLSKNMKDAPTWFYYVRTLREEFPGITDKEIRDGYGQFLTDLRDKTSSYFVRYPILRNKHQKQSCIEGIKQTAIEMLNPDTPVYASPGWMNCNFCLFKGPCITKDSGGNYEALLEHEYNLRTGHESMRQENDQD